MTLTKAGNTIPLLDLAALHAPIRDEIIAEIVRVVDSQKFILGEDVKQLERLIADYCGTRFAIACASGSDALFLALLACDIKPGDHVLTTPYSFFATAGAISRAGAVPVFVDIDPVTYNLNADDATGAIERDDRIRAVIPVHLFGGTADMDPILESARRRGCAVIEDGAQSVGAEYKTRKAQSLGDVGCISFFPSKNLGGFGDGGIMTTNSETLSVKLRALRTHGSVKKYYHEWIGINSRLDTLQAAILKVKFRYLDHWTDCRQHNADLYRERLETNHWISLPRTAAYQTRHVYNQFVVRMPQRDRVKAWLDENGVSTEVYYPLPLHLQPCYKNLGYQSGDFPHSEAAATSSLALPVHPALTEEDIEHVCNLLSQFPFESSGPVKE